MNNLIGSIGNMFSQQMGGCNPMSLMGGMMSGCNSGGGINIGINFSFNDGAQFSDELKDAFSGGLNCSMGTGGCGGMQQMQSQQLQQMQMMMLMQQMQQMQQLLQLLMMLLAMRNGDSGGCGGGGSYGGGGGCGGVSGGGGSGSGGSGGGGSVGGADEAYPTYPLNQNGSNGVGGDIVDLAASRLGDPYSQPKAGQGRYTDCSYLAQWCYKQKGINLPRTAAEQAKYCEQNGMAISKDQLQEGDLVFWSHKKNGRYKNITHVGIYAGNGMVIDASSSKGKVVHRKLFDSDKQVSYARPTKK